FFFQAEDGIRDGHVTGVQTCALPISMHIVVLEHFEFGLNRIDERVVPRQVQTDQQLHVARGQRSVQAVRIEVPILILLTRTKLRSEERRVGKECGSRWSSAHYRRKE